MSHNLIYIPKPVNKPVVKDSASILDMMKFFDVYISSRKENLSRLRNFEYSMHSFLSNCRVKTFKDANGNFLAGYTYNMRKTTLGKPNMYIDGFARDVNNENSKEIMTDVYTDIKKTAIKNKADELSLFVFAIERKLRKNYENLGFKIDNLINIEKVYFMTVKVDKFLDTTFFKTKRYKESVGIDFIIQNVPIRK